MPFYQLFYDVLFYLFFRILLQVDTYPRLRESRCGGISIVRPINKSNLKLPPVKFVGDDNAVTVSLQGSLGLGDE